ncbi:hypothetical protein ACH5RR_025057 [Cinchona calisaya]|uniref:Strictosidine synthase conserved region domain-containing protein n=1 Tax=Cinchona calisaya TaxID=153742 RepID=A0ABD2Z1X0_9GENT
MGTIFRQRLLTILSIIIQFTFFLHTVQSLQLQTFQKLPIPANGPESMAFDSKGHGPYTGINDGRIVKYLGPKKGFVDFATTSANRTKKLCDGNTNSNLELTCGRTMGLEFNHKTGQLYALDARYGPMVVGPNGGLATPLAPGQPGLEGVPHDLPDGLDVDQVTGDVYFTYAGSVFLTGNLTLILSGDTGGRLLKYDPKTKKVTLALDGLSGPFGNAVSKDGKYVLITEYITRTIRKFWLKGPKANTSEVIVTLPGHPDNIKRTNSGNFWVAQTIINLDSTPPSSIPLGQKINAHGKILETLKLDSEYPDKSISEVNEHDGSLYIGTGSTNFVGLFLR